MMLLIMIKLSFKSRYKFQNEMNVMMSLSQTSEIIFNSDAWAMSHVKFDIRSEGSFFPKEHNS